MSLRASTTLQELHPLDFGTALVRIRRPVVLMQTVGKEVAVALQKHFKQRDGEGNRHGWPSRHFWKRVADKTSHQNATADGVTVTVASREFVHKLTGGRIVAKEAGALAIPLTAEAYAKQGKGTDLAYIESFEGRLFDGKGAVGRYVRLYSNGNTSDELNHYCEVEVHGSLVK